MLRTAYFTCRNSAKVPGVITKYILRQDAQVQKGIRCCHIGGYNMDDDLYKELCEDTELVLKTIWYCQAELGLVEKSLMETRRHLNPNYTESEQKKRLINHDFLVVKMKPGKQDGLAFYIRADKVAGGDDGKTKAGIYITTLEGDDDVKYIKDKCRLLKIKCCSCIRLKALEAILKENPDYDAMGNNCSDYARRTTKWLLEECITASDEPEKKLKLDRELRHLEGNIIKQHAANTLGRAQTYMTNVWNKAKSY